MVEIFGETDTYIISENDTKLLSRNTGKFSRIYVANRKSDNQKVILKKLNPSLKNTTEALKRFKQEAQLKIDSPHIAQVTDYFVFNNDYFIARNYIEGKTWREQATEIKSNAEHLNIAIEALVAINNLHKQNIIHRDVRPDNIIVNKHNNNWQVVIIDLGLAKTNNRESGRTPFSLTYSPPEQVLNCNPATDYSSDYYALAVSLFEMITGTKPYYNTNPELLMHLQINTPLPGNNKISQSLKQVLDRATHKHKFMLPPNKYKSDELQKMLIAANCKRYTSANDFAFALKNCV